MQFLEVKMIDKLCFGRFDVAVVGKTFPIQFNPNVSHATAASQQTKDKHNKKSKLRKSNMQ